MLSTNSASTELPETQILTNLVQRVLQIQDITTGDAERGYLVRYRGLLTRDSVEAYDELEAQLRPLGFTPLFRKENDQHVILLVSGVLAAKASNPRINLILFILTFFLCSLPARSMYMMAPSRVV